MAAETLRAAGHPVTVFDAMGSVGRKFLIAGKGGLNLTHAEPLPDFIARFRERQGDVAPWLDRLGPADLRHWASGLGVETFVGSSGRVFPADLKAAPLLRGWVRRLREQGVRFQVGHRWLGFAADGGLIFDTIEGEHRVHARATVLAMGGGSWPELGSTGAWLPTLAAAGVEVAPLQPANCGFDVAWSAHFSARHAGVPVKPVRLAIAASQGPLCWRQGECVVTEAGLEGSLVYALSAELRDAIRQQGYATLLMDLVPGKSQARLASELSRPRGGRSASEHLRRSAGIAGVQAALLREVLGAAALEDAESLARSAKQLPVRLLRPRPIAEAISSAGGVRLEALDAGLMLRARPGVFVAGEMLDWEAPTGGYLLTACFASGRVAGEGALRWLAERRA